MAEAIEGLKITELNELTSVVDGDIIPVVDDPTGTPETKKASRASFLGVNDPWTDISSFTNSWTNYNSSYNSAGYYKDALGVVHLRGMISSGTMGNSAFTLPSGYRPGKILLRVVASNGAFGDVYIRPDGTVSPTVGNNAYVSLDGLSFKAG
jgi:hypothetical protein